MKKVFVYGTLKSDFGNNHYLKDGILLEKNYRLDGFGLYNFMNKVPFAVKENDSFIIGEVWNINDTTEKQLDLLEGVENGMYDKFIIGDLYLYINTNKFKSLKKIESGVWNIF